MGRPTCFGVSPEALCKAQLVTVERLTIVDYLSDILLIFGFYQAGAGKAKWVVQNIDDVETMLTRNNK